MPPGGFRLRATGGFYVTEGADGAAPADAAHWTGQARQSAPAAAPLRQRIRDHLRAEGVRTGRESAIARALALEPDEQEGLAALLADMVAEGELIEEERDVYAAPEALGLVAGRLQGNPRGFGFVVPDVADLPDLYIGADAIRGAMHGDRVMARQTGMGRDGAHPEGEIERIVRRAHEQLVGNLEERPDGLVCVPDERRIPYDIRIDPEHALGATPGEKVVVTIRDWPDGEKPARGQLLARLGRVGAPGVDILAIIHKHELPLAFPDEVTAAAEAIPDRVTAEEVAGRWDLRELPLVTIDAEESRDLDDAVSLEVRADGYRLGVHIADVSHYVREGSTLDREAHERATSVYLVDRVIPMLPERLSNGICSLNPRVDRLTLSVFVDFDREGHRRSFEVGRSVIRTTERMTYKGVNKVLDGDAEARARYAPLVPMFEAMRTLMGHLRDARERRGAIDFDLTDAKVILDAEGHPVEIVRRERTVADQIIEEFMLAANEAVAERFSLNRVPFLYRVHEEPDKDRLESLAQFLGAFGYRLPLHAPPFHPRMLQAVLERVQGRPEEHLVSAVTLRSLRRARYSAEGMGHFGLAAVYYTHFTSPIRRYPDLQIHRIIGESLDGVFDARRRAHYEALLPEVADHSTQRERRAEEAERDSVDMKKTEYMAAHVGEEFAGMVSGVTPFGLFVELENTCEGLVHVSSFLDDYYQYQESQYALVGERTGRMFRLADRLRVRVMRVDPARNQVELALTDFAEAIARRQSVSAGPRGASRPYSGPPRPQTGATPQGRGR